MDQAIHPVEVDPGYVVGPEVEIGHEIEVGHEVEVGQEVEIGPGSGAATHGNASNTYNPPASPLRSASTLF